MTRTSGYVASTLFVASCVAACSGARGGQPSSQSPSATAESPEPEDLKPCPVTAQDRALSAAGDKASPSAGKAKSLSLEKFKTKQLMNSHFQDADLIRVSVVTGQLQDAKKPAHRLVQGEGDSDLPEAWKGGIRRLQHSARRLETSDDVKVASKATAEIGASCGDCHKQLGGPRVAVGQPPASDGGLDDRMAQHAWATERLWEGLYGPSLQAWNAGLQLLSEDPFPYEVFELKGASAESVAAQFESIVDSAPHTARPEQQAATYAALLATCATCHLAEDAPVVYEPTCMNDIRHLNPVNLGSLGTAHFD